MERVLQSPPPSCNSAKTDLALRSPSKSSCLWLLIFCSVFVFGSGQCVSIETAEEGAESVAMLSCTHRVRLREKGRTSGQPVLVGGG